MLESEEMRKVVGFILSIFFAFIFLLIPQLAFADANFTTDYNVTYNVLENALTHVTFDITLANKTSQFYASSYSVQVGFKDIENVLARDNGGKITPQISKNNDGNSIEISFNDRVVGLDKKLYFSISFDTKDIAQRSGQIWDINIPGLSEQKAYSTFNVKVIVPSFLESPSYIKPDSGKLINNNLTFTKEELGESGISIAFGKEQIYNFNLAYHLKNSNLFPVKTEIALPPSTNYQDIQISSINPRPQNVTVDSDGNWLAQYTLTPGKKIDIFVDGIAKIMLSPKKAPLSDMELAEYVKEQPYWQTNNQEIKDLALQLKTPYAIYQYVVDKLTYDYDRVQNDQPRVGADGVLKNPTSAVCLEFTDLFVTIARAAGIPAREVNGFAFTSNSKERPLSLVKDILHAWPEYYDYDLQTWVMIDPTWSNTTGGVDYFYKLDFDHLAFVIKGASSTYPVPAGGYKISENNNSKDINVSFGDEFAPQTQTLTLSSDLNPGYFSGTKVQGNILINNAGHIMSSPQEIVISTDLLQPLSQKIIVGSIPPFGFIKIPIGFKQTSFLTNKTDAVRIAINENYVTYKIRITPFILNLWTILGGFAFVSIIIGLSFAIYKVRHLSFSKQKGEDPLRGQSEKP
ncbi:MAG: transglutaminase protein [Candidatus Levybacteria bacterium]|nr:transglutaminase protein [Candidatus Levybacteria bacterium]